MKYINKFTITLSILFVVVIASLGGNTKIENLEKRLEEQEAQIVAFETINKRLQVSLEERTKAFVEANRQLALAESEIVVLADANAHSNVQIAKLTTLANKSSFQKAGTEISELSQGIYAKMSLAFKSITGD